jgi:ankyrin repeat protein
MLAASFNRKDAVKELLAAGADRTIKNKDGKTAFDIATQNKYKEIADMLK